MRETFQECALREFQEETGVDLDALGLIQSLERPVAFDAPERDPRSRIISGAVLIRICVPVNGPSSLLGTMRRTPAGLIVANCPGSMPTITRSSRR